MLATSRIRTPLLALIAAGALLLLMHAGPPGALAQTGAATCDAGRSVQASKISVQLYTFNRYIERGIDTQPGAPGPAATRAERL